MPYKDMKDRDTYPAYDQTEKAKTARAARNKARRMLVREGVVKKGDGKDVGHKRPLSKGGTTVRSNLRVESQHANRSYDRNADHSIKKK
jgi:hypothetical protein